MFTYVWCNYMCRYTYVHRPEVIAGVFLKHFLLFFVLRPDFSLEQSSSIQLIRLASPFALASAPVSASQEL